jgi:hypothetical protein
MVASPGTRARVRDGTRVQNRAKLQGKADSGLIDRR